MPTIVPADSVSSLNSRCLGDPFLEIAWLSPFTLEQYETQIERDDSFALYVLLWLRAWFNRNALALQFEENLLKDISVENFMEKLDTGVVLCRLAELIVAQSRRPNTGRPILLKCVPNFEFKTWMQAPRNSFYARDNVVNFTRWCKSFGVNESVLFESDGLVLHHTPRYVLLVLLELCRLCALRGIDPPSVEKNRKLEDERKRKQLELKQRQHEEELRQKREQEELQIKQQAEKEAFERKRLHELKAEVERAEAERKRIEIERKKAEEIRKAVAERIRADEQRRHAEELRRAEELKRAEEIRKEAERQEEEFQRKQLEALKELNDSIQNASALSEELRASPEIPDSGISTPICFAESLSITNEQDDQDDQDENIKPRNFKSRLPIKTASPQTTAKPSSVLDEKVNTIVNKVLKGAKLHRLSEGKYMLNGRPFLVRLVNEKQVMVRVGGGWNSLEEMLQPRGSLRKTENTCTIHSKSKNEKDVAKLKKALSASTQSLNSSISSSSSRIPIGNRPKWK